LTLIKKLANTFFLKVNENQEFVLSFSHRSLENIEATTYYAFTYPYTYTDLCNSLSFYEKQFPLPSDLKGILILIKNSNYFILILILFYITYII
jgi:hypothetical protein